MTARATSSTAPENISTGKINAEYKLKHSRNTPVWWAGKKLSIATHFTAQSERCSTGEQ